MALALPRFRLCWLAATDDQGSGVAAAGCLWEARYFANRAGAESTLRNFAWACFVKASEARSTWVNLAVSWATSACMSERHLLCCCMKLALG